jgi:hypothetical protein
VRRLTAPMSAPVSAGRHNLLASPDPGELGDHHRDPRQGPQVGVELISPGALQQGLLDLGSWAADSLGSGPVGPDRARHRHRPAQNGHARHGRSGGTRRARWQPRPGCGPGRTARRRAAVGPHGWHAHLGTGRGWSTSPDPHTASTQPSTQPTGEVAQRLGLGLDPVQPGGAGEHVGEFDGVGRGLVGDPAVGASGQVRAEVV